MAGPAETSGASPGTWLEGAVVGVGEALVLWWEVHAPSNPIATTAATAPLRALVVLTELLRSGILFRIGAVDVFMLAAAPVGRAIMRFAAGLGAFGVVWLIMLAGAPPASAHPLGNFTVNRYARVEVSAGVVRVYYVLDEAEIPTFQEGAARKADPVGFGTGRAAELRSHLRLTIDGVVSPMATGRPELELLPGQAGLSTMHLAVLFSAPLPGSADASHTLGFADANEPDHIGWREITVVARGDAKIESSSAPATDISKELTSYPGNLIQSPLDLRQVTATFTAGSQRVAPVPFLVPARAVGRAGAGFAALINRPRVGFLVLLGLLGVAFGFGAVHALAPGHGKTIMAAYLLGTKGRPRDAVFLGTIVSLMHTASVLALGAGLYAISRNANANPARIYPYLKIVSGLAIGVWGTWLVAQRVRVFRRGRQGVQVDPLETPAHHHAAAGDDHRHEDHDHAGHTHGPGGHTHELPEGVAPMSRRGLILLASGGGLFASPSAVLVLISALELHRTGLGLALIGAFSVGLAATLTGVGLALIYGRRVVDRQRRFVPVLRWLPMGSAAAIMVLGVAFAVSGLTSVR